MKKLLIISFCSFLAAASVSVIEKQKYPLELEDEVRFVPGREMIYFLCLDHRGLASDLFFIKVILHSGSLMWKPLKYDFDSRWSFQMMDLVTDLDPKNFAAYLFSGMGLIHYFDDVRLARPILEKGMKFFPESWELPFWIGYDYYIYLEDYQTAGEYLWRAARKPGAPRRFFALLLTALRKGGAYEKGTWVLESMLGNVKDDRVKIIYQKKLNQLKELVYLQKSVQSYRERTGHFPNDLNDLVSGGTLERIPDPGSNLTYVWDRKKARVVLNKKKSGAPL